MVGGGEMNFILIFSKEEVDAAKDDLKIESL